jgi:hypothetical protein
MIKNSITEIMRGREVAQHAYPAKFLFNLSREIGIADIRKRKAFVSGVRYAGERYYDLKRMNQNRLQPNEQNKLLDQYRDALLLAQKKYKEIHNSTSTSTKLGKAIRLQYERATEAGMKEMFTPYCDGQGIAITLFERFLGELADAADNAKSQDIGNDRADLSSQFLMMWVAAIGKFWPQESKIKFAMGKYDSGIKIYTSPCLTIIRKIICRIEPAISEKDIETAMRKVKEKDLVNQPLALFLLG